jgi:hypothetical protein
MRETRVRASERGVRHVERLSNGEFANTWSGPGSGQLCSGCSRPIAFDQVEVEVELPATLRSSVLRFHADCYRIWSGEWDGSSASSR